MTSKVTYLGDLRTSCVHLASGKSILTDAPTDNFGKGETFSPTDLVATALASCMLTIIGIYCQNQGINFQSGTIDVEKIMATNPRRIQKIRLNIDLNENNWDEPTLKKVIAVGKACPIAKTLDEKVEMEFNFM
jgi:uncharacterized OsmC-like protein